jgi:alkylated DNA repair dioxygenase AlkB
MMGTEYKYSGAIHPKAEWTEPVRNVMQRVNQYMKDAMNLNTTFNSCLLNYYRTGKEYISAHSDAEQELSEHTVVSLSLGAPRRIILRTKQLGRQVAETVMPPGSLFIMTGKRFQSGYTHEIPKGSAAADKAHPEGRISLTFRKFRHLDP